MSEKYYITWEEFHRDVKALAQKIINTGYAVAQGGGKVLYFTKKGVVVLTSAGQVVTAYSSEYFDEAMQAIVSLFYK